ncbi:Rne/Rng family ribonuclease [Xanthobacter autotrophicus]|uniref:Rne/Rng family ribonuclease n=1 Tax=Xanthobacter autotrophicus TaxID=280 RepID=UPI0024A77DC0|nr:Rne/Rng family ribonuclease [Xanthobacter autotrophicus]MDI4658081.1 Rne/Rng family ribonuclease [Xanthobacter autotrophicus]
MANKMLIDATHPEETRVVVVRGNRVEEFDYESATRKQLRGNIYLAKVTRVEPSLQAAFIEYGGNRHGFLAFSEIHPDYYQIPVADRLALIEEEERAARLADDEAELKDRRRERGRARRSSSDQAVSEAAETVSAEADAASGYTPSSFEASSDTVAAEAAEFDHGSAHEAPQGDAPEAEQPQAEAGSWQDAPAQSAHPAPEHHAPESVTDLLSAAEAAEASAEIREAEVEATYGTPLPAPQEQHADANADLRLREAPEGETHPAPILDIEEIRTETRPVEDDEEEDEDDGDVDQIDEEEEIEHLGADDDAMEEVPERAPQRRARSYKIQEVIRRRQVMLVQVVKEERGNKGAALTTYLSLAGRYSVLMPNTARGGGISRKITNTVDRKRLKEVVQDLEVPEGMGIILRTAGANRTKVEIKRDFEYLLRLWETVRELTLSSAAPNLVYEEGSLIKRAIRDLYNKDIDEVHVAGEEGYREAKDFMRMLMPSHAKCVLPYREPQPIFARYGVEQQLDAMFSPVVQLKSGGYIVINPTEALVSIDVNSGRATREHHIEDTALKTNVEAAEEIARQLRLRDLAGLIVVDFIDMEEKRNNRSVERKLKDCLKNDRARIQIGRISHFGLLEMSRQRIRTGVLESSIEVCPHCGGTGHVRSAASVSLQLLRALEEQLLRAATHNLYARTRTEVALYVLNQKRAHLRELEERFSVTLAVVADESVTGHQPFIIEKGELAVPPAAAPRPSSVVHPDSILLDEDYAEEEDEEVIEETAEAEAEAGPEVDGEAGDRADDGNRKRRRRRRRRRGEKDETREGGAEGEEEDDASAEAQDGDEGEGEEDDRSEEERAADAERSEEENAERRRRRRGRRGGRRNRREREGEGDTPLAAGEADGEDADEADEADAVAEVEDAGAEAAPAFEVRIPVTPAEVPEAAAEIPSVPILFSPAPVPAVVEKPEAKAVATKAAEPEAVEPAKPRRRSTVREKAPVIVMVDDAAASAAPAELQPAPAGSEAEPQLAAELPASERSTPDVPAPEIASEVASEVASPSAPTAGPEAQGSEESAASKKSGWWQRKLFGG